MACMGTSSITSHALGTQDHQRRHKAAADGPALQQAALCRCACLALARFGYREEPQPQEGPCFSGAQDTASHQPSKDAAKHYCLSSSPSSHGGSSHSHSGSRKSPCVCAFHEGAQCGLQGCPNSSSPGQQHSCKHSPSWPPVCSGGGRGASWPGHGADAGAARLGPGEGGYAGRVCCRLAS